MIIPELSFVRYPSLLYLSSLECIVILINELELEIFVEKNDYLWIVFRQVVIITWDLKKSRFLWPLIENSFAIVAPVVWFIIYILFLFVLKMISSLWIHSHENDSKNSCLLLGFLFEFKKIL